MIYLHATHIWNPIRGQSFLENNLVYKFWLYVTRFGVAVSVYPPFSIPRDTLKLVSTYPPDKLKLEKGQFQVTSTSFRLPPGVRWNKF